MELLARHYETGSPIRLVIDAGRIVAIEAITAPASDLPVVAPGLFDLQINGFGGTWFSDDRLTADDVLRVLQEHFAFGITRLCPTLITNSFAALAHGFSVIREACQREPWADRMVAGCHLEGPHIF